MKASPTIGKILIKMTQVYFLIPGLILPDSALAHISDETLGQLTGLSEGLSQEPIVQTFDNGVFSRAVHLSWAWSVITRKPLPARTAPFFWLMDHGPALATEVWRLDLTTTDSEGRVHAVKGPSSATVEEVSLRLTPALLAEGFTLQRWDETLYLTRKNDWNALTRPMDSLEGRIRDFAADVEGEAADAAAASVLRLEAALTSPNVLTDRDRPITGLWISGGGHQANFFPPTQLRSVLADDLTIIGWAQSAGILNHRTGPVTGARTWPQDAPSGERLAVLDTLYAPWLAGDWTTWQSRIPALIAQIAELKEAARKKGCDASLVVGCGTACTVSFASSVSNPRSLLSRFASRVSFKSRDWITQDASS